MATKQEAERLEAEAAVADARRQKQEEQAGVEQKRRLEAKLAVRKQQQARRHQLQLATQNEILEQKALAAEMEKAVSSGAVTGKKREKKEGEEGEGEHEEGGAEGEDIFEHKFSNGNHYKGNYNRDKHCFEGKWGKFTVASTGSEYKGPWWDGQRDTTHFDGFKGTYYQPSGNIRYTGQWKENAKDGEGEEVSNIEGDGCKGAGHKYVGGYKNNNLEGHGLYIFYEDGKETGARMEGNFVNSEMEGEGTYTFSNGDVYTGSHFQSLAGGSDGKGNPAPGKGKLTTATKHVYDGEWISDMKHGFGTYTSPEFTFVGTFRFNKMVDGKYTFTDTGDIYEGEFDPSSGEFHGAGKYSHQGDTEGSYYKGNWYLGKRNDFHGVAVSQGNKYEGAFVNDQRDGYGDYEYATGAKYSGEWSFDKMHGSGLYYFPLKEGEEESKRKIVLVTCTAGQFGDEKKSVTAAEAEKILEKLRKPTEDAEQEAKQKLVDAKADAIKKQQEASAAADAEREKQKSSIKTTLEEGSADVKKDAEKAEKASEGEKSAPAAEGGCNCVLQ